MTRHNGGPIGDHREVLHGDHLIPREWSAADCYAMTGALRGARPAPGKAKPATGLTDGLPPVWMLHRVSGK